MYTLLWIFLYLISEATCHSSRQCRTGRQSVELMTKEYGLESKCKIKLSPIPFRLIQKQ
jgi:hypothetical protein